MQNLSRGKKILVCVVAVALFGGAGVLGVVESMSLFGTLQGTWLALAAAALGLVIGAKLPLRKLTDKSREGADERRARRRRAILSGVIPAVVASAVQGVRSFSPAYTAYVDRIVYPAMVLIGAMVLALLGRRTAEWF